MAVTHRTIRIAINTPGGIAYEWRDERAKEIRDRARVMAPVNKPANAKHRGEIVGTYKRAFRWERGRGNADTMVAIIRNRAAHAIYVELGRRSSREYQKFSWTRWGGEIRYIGKRPKFIFQGVTKVRGRRGQSLQERTAQYNEAVRRRSQEWIKEGWVPWGGDKTRARKGTNTLRNAINYIMVPWGFTRL